MGFRSECAAPLLRVCAAEEKVVEFGHTLHIEEALASLSASRNAHQPKLTLVGERIFHILKIPHAHARVPYSPADPQINAHSGVTDLSHQPAAFPGFPVLHAVLPLLDFNLGDVEPLDDILPQNKFE